jgi:putative transcriptional regulator
MKKQTKLGQSLIKGLEDALAYERGEKKLKSIHRTLTPPAPQFSKEKVRKLRELLGYTQLEFASLLNVDIGTIRHWEQGRRKPTASSNRLLQILAERPRLAKELMSA